MGFAFGLAKQEYNPERLDVFHDYQGHQGTGLLTFKNGIHGLEDAQAFQHNFVAVGRVEKNGLMKHVLPIWTCMDGKQLRRYTFLGFFLLSVVCQSLGNDVFVM